MLHDLKTHSKHGPKYSLMVFREKTIGKSLNWDIRRGYYRATRGAGWRGGMGIWWDDSKLFPTSEGSMFRGLGMCFTAFQLMQMKPLKCICSPDSSSLPLKYTKQL